MIQWSSRWKRFCLQCDYWVWQDGVFGGRGSRGPGWWKSERGEKDTYTLLQKPTAHRSERWHKSKTSHRLRRLCHSPLAAFRADRPGSAAPLEWTGTSGMASRMDCGPREDGHRAVHQECRPPCTSTWLMLGGVLERPHQKAILDSMKGWHLLSCFLTHFRPVQPTQFSQEN